MISVCMSEAGGKKLTADEMYFGGQYEKNL